VFNGSVIALELATGRANAEALVLGRARSSVVHRWFVNGRHDPPLWMEVEDPVAAVDLALRRSKPDEG
jgi:hypothetical protein